MDRYQAAAAGRDGYVEETTDYRARARGDAEEPEEHHNRISTLAAVLLILVSVILDVLSIVDVFALEIPVADLVATFFSACIWMYLLYVGIPSTRPMIRWTAMYLVEWLPFLDWLPFYLIGAILIILADRNRVVATAVKYVPSKGALKGAAASRAAGSKLVQNFERNKVYGAAGQKTRAIAEERMKKIQSLQGRLPGKLRTVPAPSGRDDNPDGIASSRAEAAPLLRPSDAVTAPAPLPPRQDGDLPFPETYYRYEQEVLPGLEEVMGDIDVSGEQAAAEAVKRAASGPAAPKKVQ